MRHDDAVLGEGTIEDRIVRSRPKLEISDRDRVMTRLPQQPGNARRQVGVDQESHAGRVSGSSLSCTAAAAYSSAAGMSAGSRSESRRGRRLADLVR